MSTIPAGFALDPRLAADTVFVTDLPLCHVRLMNDARFAWLVLVPRRAGVTEIDALATTDQTTLWSETSAAMQALRTSVPLDKINVGALGNIVRQLHMHVVARRESDAAWPGTVWGAGTAEPYSPDALVTLCDGLRAALHEHR